MTPELSTQRKHRQTREAPRARSSGKLRGATAVILSHRPESRRACKITALHLTPQTGKNEPKKMPANVKVLSPPHPLKPQTPVFGSRHPEEPALPPHPWGRRLPKTRQAEMVSPRLLEK